MKAAWGSGRRISVAAALLVLVLGAVLAWEWEQGRQLEGEFAKMRKLPVTAVPALTVQPEFSLPDVESGFPELLSRPIFFSSRRAMASASQDGAGGWKRGQYELVGVVITPSLHAALLRDVESGKTKTVAMGAQIQDLTLAEVEADKVVLRMGAESEELMLKVLTAPKPPASPASAVPPTQPPPDAQPAAAPLPVSKLAPKPVAKPLPTPTKPRELTAEELVVAEKQYKEMIADRVKKGLPLPTAPPPWAAAK